MDLLNKGLSQFGIPTPDKHAGHDRMVRWGNGARYWAKAVNDGFVFGDWVDGISESIFPEVEKQYSREEWAKRKAEIDKARKEAELEHSRLYEETSIKAVNLWDSLEKQVPEDHPYLVKKQIRAFNAKYSSKSNSIVLPLKDGEAKLWSLQFISSAGEKRFMSNGRTKGCYCSIGQPNGRIIICEGYATGISIFEATKDAVAVAFNKGNLESVVKLLKNRYSGLNLIIAADNDIREDGSNVGVDEASRVASIYGCSVVIPALQSGEKCDFNDVAVNEGLQKVADFFNPEITARKDGDIAGRVESLPGGYCLTDKHLLYTGGDSDPAIVSSKIEVIAKTRDDNSQNWGKLLRFTDPDGVKKEIAVPNTMFAADCKELRERLLGEGLDITPAGKSKLSTYLMSCNPTARALCINKTGWYKDIFVLPDTVIGQSDDIVRFQSESINNIYKIKGSVDDWRDNIAKYCAGNSRLVFAVSAAFASVMLDIVGLESGGFHFVGGSSCGKSTILKVAASVFGGSDYLRTWRATDNGLEGIASFHNDSLLILDEMGQVDSNKAGEIAYMLANGSGKTRANRNGDAKKAYSWRLLFLSSGEIDLSTHLEESKKKVKAGQEIRLLNIPAVPSQDSFGAFENVHDIGDGGKFSKLLCRNVKEFYGTPARKLIECLTTDKGSVKKGFDEDLAEFKKEVLPATASEQDQRAFNRFALVGFAGEYATAKGFTGWERGEAFKAANQCFKDWVSRRGGLGNQENKAILDTVKYFFEQNRESRFYNLGADKGDKIINMAGYKDNGADEEYFVFPLTFNNDICCGFDAKQAKDILFNNGWLKEKQPVVKSIKGKKIRLYTFTSKMWEY